MTHRVFSQLYHSPAMQIKWLKKTKTTTTWESGWLSRFHSALFTIVDSGLKPCSGALHVDWVFSPCLITEVLPYVGGLPPISKTEHFLFVSYSFCYWRLRCWMCNKTSRMDAHLLFLQLVFNLGNYQSVKGFFFFNTCVTLKITK